MAESGINTEQSMRAGWLESVKRFQGLPRDEMALFDWYLKHTEDTINQIEATAQADIAAQVSRGDSEVDDSALVALRYFTKRVRYSHVIYLDSLGDQYLRSTYDMLKAVLGKRVSLTVEDLQGEVWATMPKYFQAFGQFSIPDNVKTNVRALSDVRNILCHENGSTSKLNAQRISRLKKLAGISIVGGEIAIDKPFIEFAKSTLISLVACVDDGLREYIDRSIKPKSVR